ncbi:ABC transporter C family member [Trifolium repens]|nr:ABC transporter C family member [Trifolium repens]
MAGFWSVFCGQSGCSKPCNYYDVTFFIDPFACINHFVISCFDLLLLIMLLFIMIKKSLSKPYQGVLHGQRYSNLQLVSAITNGILGLVHLFFGIWILEEKLRKNQTALPLDLWLLELFQGLTWLLIGLTLSLKLKQLPRSWLRVFSILMFLVSGINCAISLFYAISKMQLSLKVALDVLSFPVAIVLLLCIYKESRYSGTDREIDESLYAPLNGELNKNDSVSHVTLFAKAGFFSRMSFWWMNSLMKTGKEKTLQDKDVPKLGEEDRAESCYSMFLEQLNKQKQKDPSSQPSVLKAIVLCHWREILISGFFALLKVLALSSGPLLLNSFILVAEGYESFKYEGFVLAIALFFIKNIESLSQRQWYFRSRLIGLKIRSLLTAAVYKKQLRLSNSARLMHSSVQLRRAYNTFLFWSSPVLVSAASFGACYFLNVPLHANNVFTFVATLRLVQDPIRTIPDVIGVAIQAKVAFTRILKFLEAPELQSENVRKRCSEGNMRGSISIKSADFSWEDNNVSKSTLRNVNLEVRPGQKVAICGEVGSGKSTLLAAILREVPNTQGKIDVYGKFAYVSQTAWIQTGSVRDNILFGSPMDAQKYQETLHRSSLVKDLELFPHDDLTEIGERGVNLSGGQKQRIQLARALYQNADIYLLDDPFSAVDAHTATNLFNEYIMEGLAEKTVLLVTHQVDFLPAFDFVLLMSDGEILQAAPYQDLLTSSKDFQDLVNAHKETAGSDRLMDVTSSGRNSNSVKEIRKAYVEKEKQFEAPKGDQLIKQEEREIGDQGFKPYIQYLSQNKGYIYFSVAVLSQIIFVICNILQNSWMAANVDNPKVSTLKLILVYLSIGVTSTIFLLTRSLFAVALGLQSSKSLFLQLLNSLFRAPMSFYDSTPLGRILSRVSADLSIVDLDVPLGLLFAVAATSNCYASLTVLAVVTWQVLFVSIPMIYFALRLQRYYFATAKELMRMNGTTKSFVANHLAESIAGAVTIRAFEEEDRFFVKNFDLIDINATPFFHSFSANEWLIQRLETVSAVVLASAALSMVVLPPGTFSSGFIGMALSYGLSLNASLVFSIQNQCNIANYIISVERLNQYTHVPSEAPEVIEGNRPPPNWPVVGRVEIKELQIRYRPDAPLVLRGITCTFQGGHKIGIVGRTGSGKTTLIGALFRLVEPAGGKIIVDGIDISSIGLHDLRSRFGIIPQDPTLFNGTVRYNLDPLSQHSDQDIWEVLGKCQLQEAVQEKEGGLDSSVVEDGANWSMGQRQLFCLGRALLRRSRVLVLDEATASIDNATDLILQKTIRTEFADCTVITVAHRIPTVMDCTKVLSISDGKLVEYDEPMKLMKREGSLFGKLVKEYWSHFQSAEAH